MRGAYIALIILLIAVLIDIHRRSFASWVHADRRRRHWRAWGIGVSWIVVVSAALGASGVVGAVLLILPIAFLTCYVALLLPALQRGKSTSTDFRNPNL